MDAISCIMSEGSPNLRRAPRRASCRIRSKAFDQSSYTAISPGALPVCAASNMRRAMLMACAVPLPGRKPNWLERILCSAPPFWMRFWIIHARSYIQLLKEKSACSSLEGLRRPFCVIVPPMTYATLPGYPSRPNTSERIPTILYMLLVTLTMLSRTLEVCRQCQPLCPSREPAMQYSAPSC